MTLLIRYEKVFYSDCLHSSSLAQTQREEDIVRVYEWISLIAIKRYLLPSWPDQRLTQVVSLGFKCWLPSLDFKIIFSYIIY